MNTTTFRRVAVTTGALTAVTALAFTAAAGARAAPAAPKIGTQASALAASLHLEPTVLRTPQLTAAWTPGSPVFIKKTTSTSSVLATQSLLAAGVAAGTVTVRQNSAYGCSGLLAAGGTLQVGDGTGCKALSPGSAGVKIDLSSLLSALPVGVGGLSITASAVTANSQYVSGKSSGTGGLTNAAINVCLGVTMNGACVGVPASAPLVFSGAVNENVLPVITKALTASPQLKGVATSLATLLRPALNIRANAQGYNAGTKQLIVVGLQVSLLQRTGFTNFAVAISGARLV